MKKSPNTRLLTLVLVAAAISVGVVGNFLLQVAIRDVVTTRNHRDEAVIGQGSTSTDSNENREDRSATVATLSPIDLRYCPQGAQCLMFVRPAQLLRDDEGKRVLRALGPGVNEQFTAWTAATGIQLEQVKHVVISWVPNSEGVSDRVTTVRLDAELPERWRTPTRSIRALVVNKPSPWIVLGPEELLRQIEQRAGQAPLLRRDLEALQTHTSIEQLLTVLFVPKFVVHEWGPSVESSPRLFVDSLRDIATDAQAGFLTGHISDGQFLLELRLGTTVENVDNVKQRVTQLLNELPRRVADELGGSNSTDPYWRKLAERFPAMLQVMVDRMAIQREWRQVVVTVRLPAKAAHNLVLATELFLQSRLR